MIYIYDGFMMHVLDTRRCTGEVSKLVWEGVIKEEKRGRSFFTKETVCTQARKCEKACLVQRKLHKC